MAGVKWVVAPCDVQKEVNGSILFLLDRVCLEFILGLPKGS